MLGDGGKWEVKSKYTTFFVLAVSASRVSEISQLYIYEHITVYPG